MTAGTSMLRALARAVVMLLVVAVRAFAGRTYEPRPDPHNLPAEVERKR